MRVRVRGQSTELCDWRHDLLQRNVRFAMGRLAGAIRDVSLLLTESDGRIYCSVRVRLARGNELRGVRTGRDVTTAVDAALERAARAVERKLEFERRGFARDDEQEVPW